MPDHIAVKQFIDLSSLQLSGSILDVGGGGEGVISRRCGNSVVAIDKRKDELEETPDIGLKIVMDACNMAFLDNTFDNITSFYTIMYMDAGSLSAFLKEARRVLKPGGIFCIWDTAIPHLTCQDVFIVPLEIKISADEIISTGYGVGWSRAQSIASLQESITAAGFIIEHSHIINEQIQLLCRKM